VKDVGRDTMEILHEDPVSLVLVLQQNVTLHAAVVCHQKATLTVCVERVTLARDATGKYGTLTFFVVVVPCISINIKVFFFDQQMHTLLT
jgi:hypothetical protein